MADGLPDSFPVLRDWRDKPDPRRPRSVPWTLVAPYEGRAKDNHSQTLRELASRGGLSVEELWCLLHDCSLRKMPDRETALAFLDERLRALKTEDTAALVAERDALKAENDRIQADLILLADDRRKLKDGAEVLLRVLRDCPYQWLTPDEWECTCATTGTHGCDYHLLVHAGLVADRNVATEEQANG